MEDVAIRLAGAADRVAVEACSRAAYAAFARRVGYDPEPLTADYGALIADGQVRVLELEGKAAPEIAPETARETALEIALEIAGVLVAMPKADHLLLYSVAVAPAHQGLGLGRTLMAETETIARRLGLGRVVLYTNEKMAENIRFYERLGYETFERRANEHRPGNWIVFMQKFLQAK